MVAVRGLLSLWLCGLAAAGPSVETSFGTLLGRHRPVADCEEWLGIPFAEAPVQQLRFADPQPWTRRYPELGYHATQAPRACPDPRGAGDEDCLYLNIWRPTDTSRGAGLAVMVFLYGSAFEAGSATKRLLWGNMYSGCNLAQQQGVVLVSLNYRLGPLGFGAFPNTDGGIASNFAMQDQREALRWIRREARAFGGDPERVTLFGESSGAISVLHHVASPLSRGLFRAAICQSGFPEATCAECALNRTRALAERAGCEDPVTMLECLRNKSMKEVIAAADEPSPKSVFVSPSIWAPVVDGHDMPEYPMKIFLEGRTNPVPLIFGSTTDEAQLFIYASYRFGMSQADYVAYVDKFLANLEPVQQLSATEKSRLLQVYAPVQGDNRPTISQMLTDATFLCGARLAMNGHSRHSATYAYRFNHKPRHNPAFSVILGMPGAFHGVEMGFLFGLPTTYGSFFEGDERDLSTRLQEVWTNFGKELNPRTTDSANSSVALPLYLADSQRSWVFDAPADGKEEHYREEFCKLWSDISYSKLASPQMPHATGPLSLFV